MQAAHALRTVLQTVSQSVWRLIHAAITPRHVSPCGMLVPSDIYREVHGMLP